MDEYARRGVKMAYLMRESDKHFLWSLLGAVGIILFWRGLWNGIDLIGDIPRWGWLATPALSLFVGLLILTLSGLIFQQFDPLGGLEKSAMQVLHNIHTHPRKKEFTVTYYDSLQKKDIHIKAENIRRVEKNTLAVHEKGKEIFIPIHKVTEVHQKGKIIWKI